MTMTIYITFFFCIFCIFVCFHHIWPLSPLEWQLLGSLRVCTIHMRLVPCLLIILFHIYFAFWSFLHIFTTFGPVPFGTTIIRLIEGMYHLYEIVSLHTFPHIFRIFDAFLHVFTTFGPYPLWNNYYQAHWGCVPSIWDCFLNFWWYFSTYILCTLHLDNCRFLCLACLSHMGFLYVLKNHMTISYTATLQTLIHRCYYFMPFLPPPSLPSVYYTL